MALIDKIDEALKVEVVRLYKRETRGYYSTGGKPPTATEVTICAEALFNNAILPCNCPKARALLGIKCMDAKGSPTVRFCPPRLLSETSE